MSFFVLFLQIGVILITARIVGAVFRKIHQPQVVGEMMAGILLGPSLFGWLAPGTFAALFPPASISHLNSLSQLGLVLFMFLVGLSLHPKELHDHRRAVVLISHAGIAVPFTLAAALSLFLYPRLSNNGVKFGNFALFMGAAMSITAFPVLARILTERGLLRTRLGTLSIACAAVGDVTGWCILAYIIVVVRASSSVTPVWITLIGSLAFLLFMMLVVKRLLKRFEVHFVEHTRLSESAVSLVILFVLASALVSEALGVHLLFGSFLAGVVMPKSQAFVRALQEKFESVTVTLLLPLFFALTGLRTSISLVKGGEMWSYCVAIIAVAIVGKLGGSMMAAWIAGISWRDAGALGILMNTRGLMELVILNIGLDLKILSPALFSMMVVMALVTTLMTAPLLNWICPHLKLHAAVAEIHVEMAMPAR